MGVREPILPHMIDSRTPEELIRDHVPFHFGVSSDGWNVVYCEYCGDGRRVKGPRGGWLFSDGGASAFYHCFNCGANESFSTQREYPFSKKMRDVLNSFGVPEKDYNMVAFSAKMENRNNGGSAKPVDKNKAFSYKPIDLPKHFYPLQNSNTEIAKTAAKFLKDNYGLNKNSYNFYLSTGIGDKSDAADEAKARALFGRIIIPYYKSGSLIYYEARDFTESKAKKYINAGIPASNILFNVDLLFVNKEEPLYIVEGAFDAIHLAGVATMHNEFTSAQLELLKKSKRRKIIVPDFGGDSSKMVEQAIEEGWEVSFPEYSKSCKDVSESILRHGKLWTFYDISINTKTASEAKLLHRLHIKRK